MGLLFCGMGGAGGLVFFRRLCYGFPMETYELIRSDRRTVAVEVTREGRVLVRAPRRLSQAAINGFLQRHEAWIIRQVEKRRATPPPPEPTAAEIAALKARARAVLPEKVDLWARRMGVTPTGVKITAARKRYGSCSGRNSLCFSCFLMNCPEEAVDLVVVHELCHIRVKNHGPDFYALLARYLPDYQERKKLLK